MLYQLESDQITYNKETKTNVLNKIEICFPFKYKKSRGKQSKTLYNHAQF